MTTTTEIALAVEHLGASDPRAVAAVQAIVSTIVASIDAHGDGPAVTGRYPWRRVASVRDHPRDGDDTRRRDAQAGSRRRWSQPADHTEDRDEP